jgi:tetratricopeptide (TPR) repeat protein
VLEGSVRKAGNTVRITAQLIDARSDTHLWSDTWDRDLVSVFAIQDEIAALVAEELKLALLGDAQATTGVDLRAYDAVLRGRHFLHQYSEEDDVVRRARALFEEAIAIAPDYAPAHAWLAKSLVRWIPGDEDRQARMARVENLAMTALELDPNESTALAILGDLKFWNSDPRDEDTARRLWLKAIESNPSNADAYWSLSSSYGETDPVLFLEYSRRAHQVDPAYWATAKNYAVTLTRFGRNDEALAIARDYHDLVPDSIQSFDWYVDYSMRTGNLVEVVKLSYWLYRTEPDEIHFGWLPWAMLELGELELATSWSLETERRNRNWRQMNGPHVRAIAANRLGRRDDGMQLLTEAADSTDNGNYRINVGASLMNWDKNFVGARQAYEQVLGPLDGPVRLSEYSTPNYRVMIGYARILLETGDEEIARDLLARLSSRLARHLDSGVTLVQDINIFVMAAALEATAANKDRALEYLQEAVSSGRHPRYYWIRESVHFENLRGDPRFEALTAEILAGLGEQRRQLAEEDLLLTPEQVMGLDEYEYDPFGVEK